MSVADVLGALAQGRRPADDGLLGNCRLEWRGGEAYGEEALLELFRAQPFAPGEGATLVETAASAAWIGADGALVADLYDGRIGRLWRIGAGEAPDPEPAVAVAFDPDLRQQRGDVLVRAEDHPELAAATLDAVVVAGHALLAASPDRPLHRARAFVLRAFTDERGTDERGTGERGTGERGTAALYAVHRLTGGAVRSGGFGHAAVLIGGGETLTVADHAPDRPWTPRL